MAKNSSDQIPYQEPLLDAVRMFDTLKIRYALIGGVASMFYGRARATEDVDFIAATGHMDVLLTNPDVMKRMDFDPSCVWKLYHEHGVTINIWKDEFVDAIIARSRVSKLQGKTVSVADANDVVAMKLRAARRRDDADISDLIRSGSVDAEIVRALVTPEQFKHFEDIIARP